MFQFLNFQRSATPPVDPAPAAARVDETPHVETLASLVALNQRLGREVDALREQRRAINAKIQARIAKGER